MFALSLKKCMLLTAIISGSSFTHAMEVDANAGAADDGAKHVEGARSKKWSCPRSPQEAVAAWGPGIKKAAPYGFAATLVGTFSSIVGFGTTLWTGLALTTGILWKKPETFATLPALLGYKNSSLALGNGAGHIHAPAEQNPVVAEIPPHFLTAPVKAVVESGMGAFTDSFGKNGKAREIVGHVGSMVKHELKPGGALHAMSERTGEVLGPIINDQVQILLERQMPVFNAQLEAIVARQIKVLPDRLNAATKAFLKRFRREQLAEGGELNLATKDATELFQQRVDHAGSIVAKNLKGVGAEVNDQLTKATNTLDRAAARAERVVEVVDNKLQKLLLYGGAAVLVTAVGYYTVRLLYNNWERALAKPKLVISTTLNQGPLDRLKGYFTTPPAKKKLVFSPEIGKRLNNVVATTKSIHEKIMAAQVAHKVSNVKYRNLLLWGKPGGGKTAFAAELAKECGMDVVVVSGAAFAQYKDGEGITEMNKLFDDIHSSPKGVLVFMDEADSFTGGRNDRGATAKTSYQLVNNWLHHTGGRSSKVMFVYATNRPDAFDDAFARRIDDSIEITLPGIEERESILRLYRDTLMLDEAHNSAEFMESVRQTLTDAFLFDTALATDGLSGGELEGIINAMISDASVADNGLLTRAIADDVVTLAVKKNREFNAGFIKPQGKAAGTQA